MLFFGPSLLRVLYAYYPVSKINASGGKGVSHKLGAGKTGKSDVERDLGKRTPDILDIPGFGLDSVPEGENADFWMNLASDLFDHPFGLLVYLRDAQNDSYGGFYLEDTNLQAHQFNVNASSVLVAEGTSCQYDKLVPVNITLPTK